MVFINHARNHELSSAKFFVCFNFQSASILLKVGENVVSVSNSLDQGETPSNSVSHPDPSCLHIAVMIIVVSSGLRVNP